MTSAEREADRLARQPADLTQQGNGLFYRAGVLVCEDCWRPMPRYVDFPDGLTSPESDGDAGGNFAKRRPMNVEGKEGIEALRKAVCLPCYQAAFARVYPGAKLAKFRDLVIPPTVRYTPEPEAPLVSVSGPRGD